MGLRQKIKTLTKPRNHAETPWLDSMTTRPSSSPQNGSGSYDAPSLPNPTIAAFSPNQQTAARSRNTKSVLIHQKSPLLVSTPPQVTRALAYSHPFILPLNHLVGLLSWTTGDPWESFLLLSAFWFTALYGDVVIRWAGPLLVVVALILGMYSRRYSPLSSTVWTGEKAKRKRADSAERKSLDEILEVMETFTARCDVLLDPILRFTEFLSTQTTATSATTRPALTSLFLRIMALTPFWMALTLPPWHIITTKRIVLTVGTIGLSWHSRPARVTRAILWRSASIRRLSSLITGLDFPTPTASSTGPTRPGLGKHTTSVVTSDAGPKPGVRLTFSIWENQRRWLGLGWTASLLSYERQAWTDQHYNPVEDPDHFELPDTGQEKIKWRWVPGSEWRVEGARTDKEKSAKRIGGGGGGDDVGWIYYDTQWADGRKVDGWSRYTRSRKWVRDAELVDVNAPEKDDTALASPTDTSSTTAVDSVDAGSAQRKGWFGGAKRARRSTGDKVNDRSDAGSTKAGSGHSIRSRDDSEDDVHTPAVRYRDFQWDRSIGEGVMEGLS